MLRSLLKEEKNNTGFASLSSSTNVVIKLESMNEALKFVKTSEYIPKHSQLDLKFGSYSKNKNKKQINEINEIKHKKKIAKFFEIVSEFRIKSFWCSRENEENIERVINILSHSSAQKYLSNFK